MIDCVRRRHAAVLVLVALVSFPGCTGNSTPQNGNKAPIAASTDNAGIPAPSTAQPSGQSGAPQGFIDDAKIEDRLGGKITVNGWAADVQEGSPVKKVEVFLNGKVVAEALLAKERPDVGKTFNRPDWLRSGWEATISLNDIAPGKYLVTAAAYDSGGAKGLLGSPREVEVHTR